jgi:hypothetical protein
MSTNSCLICDGPHLANGLCRKHYQRFYRRGDPYAERRPRCKTCMEMYRILGNPNETVLEKYADILLLFETGSSYILRDVDKDGRDITPRFRRIDSDETD